MLVGVLRISERHFSAEILLAAQQRCKRITTVVTRKHSHYNSIRKRYDFIHNARTSFVQDKHQWLTCSGKSLHKILLLA